MKERFLPTLARRALVAAVMAVAFASMAFVPAAKAATNFGWDVVNGTYYWYENGVMARSKEIYDPGTDAWYWIDADGSRATNKDAYIPAGDKWVRYDENGRMVKGEDYRYGGWYYFDPVTGAMMKGFQYVSSNGGKWVFYDYVTGQMVHGERYIDGSHGDEPGWMLFDTYTGAVQYGWKYVDANGGKWVYYHPATGRMVKGSFQIDGGNYYFDQNTGACSTQPGQPIGGGGTGGNTGGGSLSTTVYVTPSGSKYHYDWCPSLSRSTHLTAMSASQALNRGYGPCKVCNPPS